MYLVVLNILRKWRYKSAHRQLCAAERGVAKRRQWIVPAGKGVSSAGPVLAGALPEEVMRHPPFLAAPEAEELGASREKHAPDQSGSWGAPAFFGNQGKNMLVVRW